MKVMSFISAACSPNGIEPPPSVQEEALARSMRWIIRISQARFWL